MIKLEIPELNTKELRQFGLILGCIITIVPGLFLPKVWDWENYPNQLWMGTGMVIIVWSLIAPASMRHLYKGWMHVAMIIGGIINTIILAAVFFMLITPMGIAMQFMGKDPMLRTLDKSVKSYRIPSKIQSKNHVERPY